MVAAILNKERLIEAVRRYPCLYNTTKKEYKDESIRENAWRNVCNEVLEKTYQNEKELIEESGSAGGVPLEPSWPYFRLLEFLAPFLKHRQTLGNLQMVSDDTVQASPESCYSNALEVDETEQQLSTLSSDTFLILEQTQSSKPNSPVPAALNDSVVPKKGSTSDFINTASKKGEADEDNLFGQSIGKELKN
ncbi:uncharacterized protein LOC135688677 [Rhopilema esculentum]|uniref:uncharacterized protein LOC135688677 n=1 Tax=Rhopilema esculentum TaxID=499914 RepID=UPI0031CDB0C4|eukprot:gene3607-13026_t